jgi:hypothetical protein
LSNSSARALDLRGNRLPSWQIALLLIGAFGLRLLYGLASDFWGGDPLQIFLIGLRAYTVPEWPYFGPDVVYTQTQVPGAMQGLVIAVPLRIVAQPEAPIVLLNVLSFAGLVFLAWYVRRRVPEVPAWFTWPWLLFSPWTLNLSTHILNPSYVLPASILFFICLLELMPSFRLGVISEAFAFFALGASLLWIAQFHLSAVVLVPLVGMAFVLTARRDSSKLASAAVWFVAGALLTGSTLMPTLWRFGIGRAFSAGANAQVTFENLYKAPQLIGRFLSFASFELPRFLGPDTPERLAFLGRHLWVVPFALFAGACGVVQALILFAGFLRTRGSRDWIAIRRLTIGMLLLVYASFAFSIKNPASQAFYVVLPLVMIYSFYCWAPFFRRRAGRVVAASLLVAGALTHLAIAVDNFRGVSLYTNRALVVRAIQEKNYRLLGERRSVDWGLQRD